MSLSRQFQRLSSADGALALRNARVGRAARYQQWRAATGILDVDEPRDIASLLQQAITDAGDQDLLQVLEEISSAEEDEDSVDEVVDDAGTVDEPVEAGNERAAREPRAWAWHFFDRVSAPGNRSEIARCMLVPDATASSNQPKAHNIHVSTTGGTSNLVRHLEAAVHARSYARFQELRDRYGRDFRRAAEQVIAEAEEKQRKRIGMFSQGRPDERRLQQELQLFSFFVERGISFASIESSFFANYHSVCGWQLPPNRARFSSGLLSTCYNLCFDWISSQLEEADYFSVITDAWTSAAMEKYVALNVSFIDRQYDLKTLTLAVIPLNVAHTWVAVTKAIAVRLQNALPADSTLVATVTDNGANFVKVAKALHTNLDTAAIESEVGDIDSWDEPVDDGEEVTASWRCVAHKAQLAVNDMLRELEGNLPALLEKAREMTRFIRSSPERRAALIEAQRKLKSARLAPTLDVPTRWLSLYYLLERFVENYRAYAVMGLQHALDDLPPESLVTPEEVRKLKALTEALEPVADFVRLAEGEKYLTPALVPVYFKRCHDELARREPGFTTDLRTFRSRLRLHLNMRLGHLVETVNLALAAAALHPAYGHLQFVERELRDEVWDELAQWVCNPDKAFPPAEIGRGDPPIVPGPQLGPRPPAESAVRDELARVRDAFERGAPGSPTEIRNDIDPLAWWRTYAREVPLIKHLPRIVFSVPATSAASEREFSNAGAVATANRARLSADKVEMTSVIRSVIRNLGPERWMTWIEQRVAQIQEEKRARC